MIKFKTLFQFKKNSTPISKNSSELIKKGAEVNLYKTIYGDYYWLNSKKYLDKEIINTGIFEQNSTAAIKQLIKAGDVVFDIGANIGYYTVIMSKIVGSDGKVYSFEPTQHYKQFLIENCNANKLNNVEIINVALSNKESEIEISIGDSSATIHWVNDNVAPRLTEKIKTMTLDHFVEANGIKMINFIKIDVDGHEPLFFEGAWNTIEKFQPIIILEVSHEHYLDAGYTAWDFYDILKNKRFYIYSEEKLQEITTKREFLIKCGNFAYSANIIISKKQIYV